MRNLIIFLNDPTISGKDVFAAGVHKKFNFSKNLREANSIKNSSKRKKLIYLSHPFKGEKSNLDKLGKIAKQLREQYPEYVFISPLHAFGDHYHSVHYYQGLQECLELLARCDEMWVFGDYRNSTGCLYEIEFCKKNKISYKISTL